MLTFEEARTRVLADLPAPRLERVPLEDAAGRVLAEELFAETPLPRFDASAMDGFCLRIADLAGPPPWVLPTWNEARAGRPAPKLEPASACRILTGAPLPAGADAVVRQEDVRVEEGRLHLARRPVPFEDVRRAGEDLAKGARALGSGTRLAPGHLALAAMLGHGQLPVAQRPRVVIACSGDELRAAGQGLEAGALYDANGPALAALCRHAGASVHRTPFVPDDRARAAALFAGELERCDVLVTVGGVSTGDHDVVRAALADGGVTLDFWKVAMKPGKPLAFGRLGATRVLALPGNPAAALVTFALFGAPLLRGLQGDAHACAPFVRLPLAAPAAHRTGRDEWARAALHLHDGRQVVRVLANQAPGAAISLAQADALVRLPGDTAGFEAGTALETLRFSDV